MMDLNKFRKMAIRYRLGGCDNLPIPSEARVITGNPSNDKFFHYMLVDNGVDMILEEEQRPVGFGVQWRLTDFKVVDEQKYMMFVLRWS